jgi:hypothetical protein
MQARLSRHNWILAATAVSALLLLAATFPGLFSVEASSSSNRLQIVLSNQSLSAALLDITIDATGPAFATDIREISVPVSVPANGSDSAVIEFDIAPETATGTAGEIVLVINGSVNGFATGTTLTIPVSVEVTAPSFQGGPAQVPVLSNFMLVILALLLLVLAAVWLPRRDGERIAP